MQRNEGGGTRRWGAMGAGWACGRRTARAELRPAEDFLSRDSLDSMARLAERRRANYSVVMAVWMPSRAMESST